MKSALMTQPGNFEVHEVKKPSIISEKDVLLRIHTAGICGSDLHYFRTGRIGNEIVKYPFSMGHECTATVEEVGSDVIRVQSGDRVVVEPAIPCINCDQCQTGRFHTCRNMNFMGCPGQLEGCFSEYIVMPESCCFLLPDDMPLKEAVFCEPLSIALHSYQFIQQTQPKRIGILGAGPIGISTLLVALNKGHKEFFMTDKLDARLEHAKSFGAGYTANPDKTDIVKTVPFEPDVVFECCGQEDAVIQATSILKPGGHLVVTGIPESDNIRFPIHELRRKEISVYNVRRQNKMMPDAIDMGKKLINQIKLLITHIYSIDEIQEAFQHTATYNDGVMKAVIQFYF